MGSTVLTTDAVEPADRFAYWREVICRVYVRLDAEPADDGPFSGFVDVTPFGQVRVSTVAAGGQVVDRIVDGENEDCLVSLQTSGVGRISQGGRTAVLECGDLALYDATRPYQLAFDEAFSQVVVQFPRQYLIERNVDIQEATGQRISGRSGVGKLAASYLRALREHETGLPDPHRQSLGFHAVDLVAMALSTTVGAAPSPQPVRTYSRQRVLDYVSANLDDPGLSVGAIARALAVSPRSLQKLFADDDHGLGERIRLARLARARQALTDPLRRSQTIARIAADHGYSDAAHFTRAFKAVHGQTPRDYRQGLATGLDSEAD